MSETYKIQIVVEGQDKASAPLGKVGSALGSIGTIAGGILTAGIFTSITNAISDAGKVALSAYADYERLGMSLSSLYARELMNTDSTLTMSDAIALSSDKAKELQDWIQKVAIISPFQQKDIADAFRMTLAYGFTADEAQRLTNVMVDYTSATGASGDMMNRVALALGQIKAKGKLAGQEILQLTEAGIPVRDILAKHFEVTTAELEKMVSKGLVPADEAIEAITQSIENDFSGAAERQAGTFSGLISSLADIKEVGLREFFTGTFQAIQPYIDTFVGVLSDPATMDKIRGWGDALGGFINIGLQGIQPLTDYFSNLFGAIGDAGIWDGGFTSEFKESLLSFLPQETQDVIFGFFDQLEGVLNTFGEWWSTNGETIKGIATDLFEGLSETIAPLAQEILGYLLEKFQFLGDWFNENEDLINGFLSTLSTIIQEIVEGAGNFLPLLQNSFDWFIETLLGLGELIMQVFTGDFQGALDTAKGLLEGLFDGMWENLQLFATWILDTFFGMTFEEGRAKVDAVVQDIITWFGNLQTEAGIKIGLIVDLFNNVKDAISNAIDTVKEFLSNLADAVIPDWLSALFSGGGKKEGKAGGGWVQAGQEYIVGEEGAEIFRPSVSGRIIPNDRIDSELGSVTNQRNFEINVNNYGGEMNENTLAQFINQWEWAYGY